MCFQSIAEDTDFLKSDKVGREEFTEALAEKVDICMINRKVSHDQFNATCDDLSKGIEEALEKLMEQVSFLFFKRGFHKSLLIFEK